jgi:hypothetical protein
MTSMVLSQDKERTIMCFMCDQEMQVKDAANLVWSPETEKVSIAQLADAVREAALAAPDKIYERPESGGCKYTHNVEDKLIPGCIVGQGIFDITGKVVDQTVLTGNVNNTKWALALNALGEEPDYWGDRAPKDALSEYLLAWLREVQYRQDSGGSWGNAVTGADNTVKFADHAS